MWKVGKGTEKGRIVRRREEGGDHYAGPGCSVFILGCWGRTKGVTGPKKKKTKKK